MIEAYLVDDERAKCRDEWEVPFKCWEARCEQTDHFDAELKERLDADPDRDAILPYMPKPWKYCKELLPKRREDIRALRRRIWTYQEECKFKHHENVKIWRSKIDRLQNSESREERDPMVNVLRTDFGLIVWCTHSRWKGDEQEERDARRPPRFLEYSDAMFANFCATTIAYLRVPESVSVPHRQDPFVPAKRTNPFSEDVMIGWARSI
ncbi:hypothetical protein TI39_contig361g00003 [Zymoseptoria brevis]|uniref:Uncharacterized protein n=1 Tax=Zymoseptoria brevis TaxID=1047168 RepID=A0A0F4GPK8_9PEZI|nr:hypothetical protein TI39_contig361g00003 [Zymoseptoria brevis]